MASSSTEIGSDMTISDTTTSEVPVHEIPPAVLDVQEEEEIVSAAVPVSVHDVAPLQQAEIGKDVPKHVEKEVEVPQWLKSLAGEEAQDWRAFVRTRINGHTDRTYTHKQYRHQFRSKAEVKLFVDSNGMTTGIFKGRKLQKKIAGMDAQGAGTSESAGRRASAYHARQKRRRSLGHQLSRSDEKMPPGFI
uniref:Uncharacterized protein n=1 Tax=Zea mays TaxID=4577 RepID=A0A804NN40_MAIZE